MVPGSTHPREAAKCLLEIPFTCLPFHPRTSQRYPTCTLSLCLTILPSPPLQKLFVVPTDESQTRIPYARVNHNKYMVTERASYIGKCPLPIAYQREGLDTRAWPSVRPSLHPLLPGTSNWSGSYFTETAGTSLLVTQNGHGGLRSQLEAVFLRDWESPYSHDLDTSANSVGNACRLL